MAAARPELLDSRVLRKVEVFDGKRENFETWIFTFESYMGLLNWSQYAEAARDAPQPVTMEGLPSDDARALSGSLYYLFVQHVKGQALSVVKLVDRGNGFEALRQLYLEYRSAMPEDHATLQTTILTPTWWKDR